MKFLKCEFWFASVAFLGHIVSGIGVKVDNQKVDAVKNWPRQTMTTKIRSFLELAGYYKRFMEGFSIISELLTKLTQNKVKFRWFEDYENSFKELKDRLTSTPVLTLPDGTKGFTAYCDASAISLGCVLMQNGKIVVYASRKLKFH